MRCARTISAATAPGTSTRGRSTSSPREASATPTRSAPRRGRRRRRPRSSPACTRTTTATCTGTRRSIRRSRPAFRAFSAHGYEVASFVFDTNYLFKDLPEANVRGTSETLDGAFEWLRAKRDTPFFLYVHNWATHMPYDIVHADRKNWLAAKQEVIEGIQSDSASALEAMREGYRDGGRAPVRGARRVVPRGARDARAAREHRRSPSSPTTASRGASASPRRTT